VASYAEGNLEQDASYAIRDHLNGGGYSICSGNDTPLHKATFIWSPSELTFVILQSDEVEHHDRFVLVQDNATPDQDWRLINMKPLEQHMFEGKSARLISVSDTSIGFCVGNSSEIRQIRLEELVNEAKRQE
jgi:hypothetical protein